MSERMSEDMSERISARTSENECEKECQKSIGDKSQQGYSCFQPPPLQRRDVRHRAAHVGFAGAWHSFDATPRLPGLA